MRFWCKEVNLYILSKNRNNWEKIMYSQMSNLMRNCESSGKPCIFNHHAGFCWITYSILFGQSQSITWRIGRTAQILLCYQNSHIPMRSTFSKLETWQKFEKSRICEHIWLFYPVLIRPEKRLFVVSRWSIWPCER